MYELVMFIHVVGVAVGFITLALVCQQKSSENQKVMMIASFCGLISIIGYLFEIQAREVNEMLVSIQFGYIGKCYILIMMIIFARNYCNIKIPAILIRALFIFNSFILITILTCRNHHFYYKGISISNTGMFPHVVIDRGIGYYMYMTVSFVMVIYYCFILISQIRISNKIERKRLMLLLWAGIIPAVLMGLFLLGFADGVDFTPVGIVASSVLLSINVFKLGLLDTMDVAKDDIIKQTMEGVVVVDNNKNLLYSNPIADKVAEGVSEVYGITDFSSWIFSKSTKQFVFEIYNKQYEIKIHPLMEDDKCKGYIAWIYDHSYIDDSDDGLLL